ncbi:winged helix-turn-helix domain-containing protein [Neptunomonas antarctica]|uniref:DNA-binding response regulator, OmpR family, contains REC and winged-helix (WHTH) domain n=1 Tax=Neptunomonas antarctica TaxID=619304 RepID=A0A1N7L532_9GAMM|nr:winged helix-turn-helix domain-containing protein [Neptunomonas antarctica]SIS68975.1 DNA-binding response regulator, OmpR family, contains REC and winged-helix (wHTH) domain [Neptunomonas antarctica]
MEKTHNSILLISSNSFILGLLKGYCVANQIKLHEQSITDKIVPQEISNLYKLIIIDIRELNQSSTREQLKTLRQINKDTHIPICAILSDTDDQEIQRESWIDFYFENPIMEKLDDYLRVHFSYNFHPFPDRRDKDRRSDERRLIDANQLANSDSSMPVDFNDRFTKKSHVNNYKTGPFTINISNQSVSLKDKNLELTRKEFKLFSLLSADTERVFNAQEIIQHLWPNNDRANKSDLYQYMHLLRKKIEIDPYNPHWVLTIKGVGYKLNINPPIEDKNPQLMKKYYNIDFI